MGMPGLETALEEVMSRILGSLLQDGSIAKIADDLYYGGNTPQELLSTVSRLRSFIGAYKVLSRVIPRCSSYLTPLDAVTTSCPSQESINWTDDLRGAFRSAQNALSSALTIKLPRPEDQLWIVTDGAVRDPGIGATLYVTRGDKLHVSGFFSAK